MKKIITAALAAAFATAVQAASVNWGGAVSAPDGSALAAGQQALLLRSTVAFTGDATTLSGAAVGGRAGRRGKVERLARSDAVHHEAAREVLRVQRPRRVRRGDGREVRPWLSVLRDGDVAPYRIGIR